MYPSNPFEFHSFSIATSLQTAGESDHDGSCRESSWSWLHMSWNPPKITYNIWMYIYIELYVCVCLYIYTYIYLHVISILYFGYVAAYTPAPSCGYPLILPARVSMVYSIPRIGKHSNGWCSGSARSLRSLVLLRSTLGHWVGTNHQWQPLVLPDMEWPNMCLDDGFPIGQWRCSLDFLVLSFVLLVISSNTILLPGSGFRKVYMGLSAHQAYIYMYVFFFQVDFGGFS